ncbi:MAG: cation:proton antiporter, partial [Gemmatimonadales bacterium]
MSPFEIVAILTTLAAAFAYVNYRFIRLPMTIGLMVIALVSSIGLVALGRAGLVPLGTFFDFVTSIDFDAALLNGMLGALLFAGALHIKTHDLAEQAWTIGIFATVGVLVSTAVVGVGFWAVFRWLGFPIDMGYALLFGALISPTDPIAVGAILRKAGVPKSLEVKISGESLFNDGFGVVIFLLLLELVTSGEPATAGHVGELFLEEVVGGLLYGLVIGWVCYRLLKSVDNYQLEILITLALVTGGYALAHRLHTSGPLAMVVAGLLVGNKGRALAMSDMTRERLDQFWELVDEFLNAALFVLIGVEVVVIEFNGPVLEAAAIMIPLVLVARWISIAMPVGAMSRFRRFTPHAVKILTWSGLRGGISVALALSLPAGPYRDLVLTATYVVVCFSIIVQGLSIGPITERLLR